MAKKILKQNGKALMVDGKPLSVEFPTIIKGTISPTQGSIYMTIDNIPSGFKSILIKRKGQSGVGKYCFDTIVYAGKGISNAPNYACALKRDGWGNVYTFTNVKYTLAELEEQSISYSSYSWSVCGMAIYDNKITIKTMSTSSNYWFYDNYDYTITY